MDPCKFYLAGRFESSPEILDVVNPFTGEVIAPVYLAGVKEVEDAIRAAIKAEESMRELPSFHKFEILRHISARLLQERDRLARVLSLESGKPIRYALGEIDRSVQTFLVAAEEAKRLPREGLSLDWTPAGIGKEGWVRYFPLGLVAGIAPFNFPLNLAVHKIAPALAAGNPIILKPARSTPLSMLELAAIIHETGLPQGALSVLVTGREAGNLLVTDDRIKMVSFTGSPEVGWEIKTRAGRKKVLLELGGNAGVIVTPSADLLLAAEKILTGSFAYSGQVCIHVQRIFVHRSMMEAFSERFVERVKRLRLGDPLDPATEVSVMIDEANARRVESWIGEAVAGGAEVLCGGKRVGGMVEPTVLTRTRPEMKVCSLEIFGPVVTLEAYDSFPEAIAGVNDSRYGLQAGVFTNEIGEMNQAFEQLEVGGVIINDVPTFRVDHMPYGGVKDSGFGREGVRYSILEMMEPKLLVRNTGY
ncbi:MAG: aldehyde dehydrogenase family protein [Prolixibacteraceae bacterium]|jgi:glyceraldehyde-3-phosphate dehydrogenase (NADP+)|nr:aldehyde dehydrogenase family protein [Prolixibacteraceae bacterium]